MYQKPCIPAFTFHADCTLLYTCCYMGIGVLALLYMRFYTFLHYYLCIHYYTAKNYGKEGDESTWRHWSIEHQLEWWVVGRHKGQLPLSLFAVPLHLERQTFAPRKLRVQWLKFKVEGSELLGVFLESIFCASLAALPLGTGIYLVFLRVHSQMMLRLGEK